MASIIALRDGVSAPACSSDLYSPAKEKAANRGAYHSRPLLRRIRSSLGGAKAKLLLAAGTAFALLLIAGRVGSLMGWNLNPSSSVSSPSRSV